MQKANSRSLISRILKLSSSSSPFTNDTRFTNHLVRSITCLMSWTCTPRRKLRMLSLMLLTLGWLSSCPDSIAEDYVVLDGFRGLSERYMEMEVNRLRLQGHRVLYLPWWRWRFAARNVQRPVNVIGYSLGGSRAAWLSQRIDVRRVELVDPVRLMGPIRLPQTTQAAVYRATVPSSISSSPVLGHHHEILIHADHGAMPRSFHWFRP